MSRTDNHQDIAQDVFLERLTTYCTLVAVAILFFDHFLTLSSEIRFIWPARWSFGKVLYFLTKYLVFFDVAITLFIYFAPKRISPATCNTLYRIESISYTVGIAIAELILAFRTWTIWWNHRWIVWILRLALFTHIVPVIVMAGLGVHAAESSPTLGESKLEVEHFNPITPDLTPSDSGLLPSQNVTSYLDSALKVLGLHTEARTSFITFVYSRLMISVIIISNDLFYKYWLPSLLKHKHVALRFLPQVAYERAALLDASPRPNIIMRVFMLFKRVNDDELESSWNHAVQRASRDVDFWVDVVGVDIRRATDFSLFRILERGGIKALWHYFILPVTDIESQLARTCIF
ncbi:hypothetical protein M422DRAFT_784968 [Sphaerobolus stellatus SS14]|uniref:DUF6533 domain-containing protein n=1 Tax=Sphaerobolus stellatus (strain SS14) TaxID=990650 RepID=A0A0C9UDY5_SPHS4|nr:hypothetical protein M422DRAFT_784968 [Sphaerobolus stellatus SS14]